MIIDTDIHPEQNLYCIGARVLELIKKRKNTLDVNYLLKEYNKKYTWQISFDYLLLALDWLYILDLISQDENGSIAKCF